MINFREIFESVSGVSARSILANKKEVKRILGIALQPNFSEKEAQKLLKIAMKDAISYFEGANTKNKFEKKLLMVMKGVEEDLETAFEHFMSETSLREAKLFAYQLFLYRIVSSLHGFVNGLTVDKLKQEQNGIMKRVWGRIKAEYL